MMMDDHLYGVVPVKKYMNEIISDLCWNL